MTPTLFDLPPVAAARPAKKRQPHHNGRDTSDVWLTPRPILEALEPFDLDPCAPEVQPWPTAGRRYTEADDGLVQPWEGRVWLNPPYSRPAYSRFMEKMAAHGWGTALIFARTETDDFFRYVWESATGALFLEGRLFFHRPDGLDPTRCETRDHEFVAYSEDSKVTACRHCGRSSANAGAPSVLVAYGQADAEILAGSTLEGAFVPLRLPRSFAVIALDVTWDQLVRETLERQGGTARVSDLYRSLSRHPKARGRQHWRAKVRQTLQRGEYRRVDRGLWAA